jgi:predicted dehydrogenase
MSIKIGIIGAGGMTNYHIPGFKEAGADVAAIADVNTAAAQRVADKFGIHIYFWNNKFI